MTCLPYNRMAKLGCDNLEMRSARRRRWSIDDARRAWYHGWRTARFSKRLLGNPQTSCLSNRNMV